jgi:hypothetical protein
VHKEYSIKAARYFPVDADIRNIINAYRFSKAEKIDFDCPFCQKVISAEERHFEDGRCQTLPKEWQPGRKDNEQTTGRVYNL